MRQPDLYGAAVEPGDADDTLDEQDRLIALHGPRSVTLTQRSLRTTAPAATTTATRVSSCDVVEGVAVDGDHVGEGARRRARRAGGPGAAAGRRRRVADRIDAAGDSPHCSTRNTHSWAFSPWWLPGVPASVPIAIVTPSSWARRTAAACTSLNSAIRFRRCSGIDATTSMSRNSSSPAQIVGTSAVPALPSASAPRRRRRCRARCCRHRPRPRSRGPGSAWQWAATCLWLSWAISTAASQLLERVLDRSRVLRLRRQHRPGGHDLDQVGAVGELATSRGADGVGAIGDLVHARVVVGRSRS